MLGLVSLKLECKYNGYFLIYGPWMPVDYVNCNMFNDDGIGGTYAFGIGCRGVTCWPCLAVRIRVGISLIFC